MGWKDVAVKLLEDNRGLVILIFCLPASFIFDLALKLRNWSYKTLFSSPRRHDERVRAIQRKIQEKTADGGTKLLCTARPNWLSLSTKFFRKSQCRQIPIPLYDILKFDERSRTVTVEPFVTVGDITHYLIPKGYTLAVTLEIEDATLGGLALGTGMTTHSHKVGLYQETVVKYEVVLSDGSLVEATKDNEHSDLYHALPWSHGSLGFLVSLTLQVIPVKPFIRLKYTPVRGQKRYCDKIREVCGAKDGKKQNVPDYIEATIFNREEAIIMTGEFSDYDPNLPVNHLTRWYKPWFYKYVETFLKKGDHEELIPLREYLLRHNRAIFWVVESMIPFGNAPLFRLLFGWMLPPKPAFLKFTTTPGVRAYTFTRQVFQDIVMPIDELEKQIDTSEILFETYPLLVYPCKVYDKGPAMGQLKRPKEKYIVPGTDYAMYNDLGVYGVPGQVKDKKPYNPVSAMRKMEEFTREIGGFSFLYADIFMTMEEFNEMFDLTLYDKVKLKYDATNSFPHLYDKVKPEIDVFAVGNKYIIQ